MGTGTGCAKRIRLAVIGVAMLLCGAAAVPSVASAAFGEPLVEFGERGAGAGQLDARVLGGGIAADPDTGHVFISDFVNDRISEFTAWGEFVKSWGWGVRNGSPESQTCTDATGCQAGLAGSAAGQLNGPNGIALDATGAVLVFERTNRRVQVFAQSGEFLRMFGGGVNQTTGADICTKSDLEGGDVCGAGVTGTGPAEFSMLPAGLLTAADYIDIGPDGTVYVADHNRIQEFEPSGTFKGQIAFATIQASEPEFPASREPGSMAVDPLSGDIYLAFRSNAGSTPDNSAWRFSATGQIVQPAPLLYALEPLLSDGTFPEAIATDAMGNFYAGADQFILPPDPDFGQLTHKPVVLQIGPDGARTGICCSVGATIPALAAGTVTAAGGVDLYVLRDASDTYVEVIGPPPDKWPPPVVPPTVVSQSAPDVGETTAVLQARINPNFWADTRYRVEYGTADCSLGGCQETPAAPGALLGAGIVKRVVATDEIELSGLQPGTTYHYRFIAQSGGGSVVGSDRTFTTFADPGNPSTSCPNQAFRTGLGANLADCRAYELVSPIDKLGGDILVQCNSVCFPARLNQSDPPGNKITYSSYRAYGDSKSAGYTTQYIASRAVTGWSSHSISPPREGGSVYGSNTLDSQYRGFLEDLSAGWLLQDTKPLLASGAQEEYANVYRWLAGSDTFETVTLLPPTNTDPIAYVPEVQGFSADGTRTVFAANGKLTPNASASAVQVYEQFPGGLRLVSVRPNGTASPVDASVGTSHLYGLGRQANVATAVSDDGSRIYWTEEGAVDRLYVRVGSTKTVAVSGTGSMFWAATPSGSKAIYTEGEQLKLFDLATETSAPLAPTVQGVVGAASDLSRVYFVATGALAGGAVAGQQNLYLYEEGAGITYIAALSADDFRAEPAVSPTAVDPWRRVSRVTPDGGAVVFMSRAALTGANNIDVGSGSADAEVFRYSAEDDELICVSCSPTGSSPTGREYVLNKKPSGYWYASQIPGWEFQLHAPRVISDDGTRVYFDSFNRLVLADTNGKQDVYQWEAVGAGDCVEGGFGYDAGFGGCVTLISSGKDESDSEFIDASADGRDAFFTTGASLVPWDPAQIDLYDARVGGGFAPPPAPPAECVGEACQPQTAPSAPPSIDSNAARAGNPKQPPRCKRGFVRKKGKCVKKHKAKHHKKGSKKPKGRRG